VIDSDVFVKILALKDRQILQLNRTLNNVLQSRGWRFVLLIRRLKHIRFKLTGKRSSSPKLDSNYINQFFQNLKSDKPNLILVNHETTLTGAPVVLLDLANAIKRKNNFNVSIINVRRRGPDLDGQLSKFNSIDLYDKNYVELFGIKDFVKSLYLTDSQATFIVNTITLNSFTTILKEAGFSFYTWVHELELSWSIIGVENVKTQLRNSKKIVVDSNRIKDQISKFDICQNVDYLENAISFRITTGAMELRKAYGLTGLDIAVTIAGSRSIRKGFDLLPYLLSKINEFSLEHGVERKIKVFWIGAIESYDLNFFITKQLFNETYKNLEVILLSNVVNYENYVNASNYFISLAREDSSPQTLFLAQNLNIPNFSLSTVKDSKLDIYGEIDLMAKSISQSLVSEFSSKTPIGVYNTWDIYYEKLIKFLGLLPID
jgi:hypothetical protein